MCLFLIFGRYYNSARTNFTFIKFYWDIYVKDSSNKFQ